MSITDFLKFVSPSSKSLSLKVVLGMPPKHGLESRFYEESKRREARDPQMPPPCWPPVVGVPFWEKTHLLDCSPFLEGNLERSNLTFWSCLSGFDAGSCLRKPATEHQKSLASMDLPQGWTLLFPETAM